MIATALAVATDADVRFQTALADHFPSALVNPTGSIERSHAVSERLAKLRGHSRFAGGGHDGLEAAGARQGAGLHRQRALVQLASR